MIYESSFFDSVQFRQTHVQKWRPLKGSVSLICKENVLQQKKVNQFKACRFQIDQSEVNIEDRFR